MIGDPIFATDLELDPRGQRSDGENNPAPFVPSYYSSDPRQYYGILWRHIFRITLLLQRAIAILQLLTIIKNINLKRKFPFLLEPTYYWSGGTWETICCSSGYAPLAY